MLTVNDLFRRVICPYCGTAIKDEPENSFYCPACNEEIFMKKVGDRKMMVTRNECETFVTKKIRQIQQN
jgi:predicted RNA-binding Zn-ribbon protein involved in translation (DUF1610 family)